MKDKALVIQTDWPYRHVISLNVWSIIFFVSRTGFFEESFMTG